jgi:hypothetical protein
MLVIFKSDELQAYASKPVFTFVKCCRVNIKNSYRNRISKVISGLHYKHVTIINDDFSVIRK